MDNDQRFEVIFSDGWKNALTESLVTGELFLWVLYRVDDLKGRRGIWRRFDGTFDPVFDQMSDCKCKDLPMEDNELYREGGKQWFASTQTAEALQHWFTRQDLEELYKLGYEIRKYLVFRCKRLNEYETIFTMDSVVATAPSSIEEIYPDYGKA